ncbi:MAG: hypothetical protein IKK06_07325 [Clostridia bacterium]|nr:hypothetical protein [Clostridia bacterium]
MKAIELFEQYFGEELLARGFVRKKNFYYRMNGVILQSILFDAAPGRYQICFNQFPYWCYPFISKGFPLSKGYWTGLRSPCCSQYFKAREDENHAEMKNHLEVFRELVFPILDATNDEKSYIEAFTKPDKRGWSDWKLLKPQPILYVCYQEGSWDFAKKWLAFSEEFEQRSLLLQLEQGWKHHMENLQKRPETTRDISYEQYCKEFWEEDCHTLDFKFRFFRLLFEKMEENDLEWIKEIHDENCEIMKEDLLRELKILL